MTPWIKMRTNLLGHPKVNIIAKKISCNAISVTGGLYMLWSLADEYSVDGKLDGYDANDIDRKFGKVGFAAALASKEVDWLEIGDNFIRIPEFEEHNGMSAKARAGLNKRVEKHRRKCNGGTVTKSLPDEEEEYKNLSTDSFADEIGGDGVKISAETVYRAYPKHVEPEPSKKSISAAVRYLRKQSTPTPWAWLLGRVRMYADARAELEKKFPGAKRFVPACHRWMKRKRFEEDPAVWATEEPGFASNSGGTARAETGAEYARRLMAKESK